MVSIKVLSRLMGYSYIEFNANKIMLLEKTVAVRIFGLALGFWDLRVSYFCAIPLMFYHINKNFWIGSWVLGFKGWLFLWYFSYALSHNKTDVNLLEGCSKKKFLRYMGRYS